MDNIKIRFVFDKKSETKKNPKSTGLIQIEIRDKRTSRTLYISTGIRVSKSQYLEKDGEVKIVKHPKSTMYTVDVLKMYNKVFNFAYSDKCYTLDDIKKWGKGNVSAGSFVKFMEDELLIKGKSEDLSYNTVKQHKVIINKVASFERLTLFKDLTHKNILDFEAHIKSQKIADPTCAKNMKILKQYVLLAKAKGYIEIDPFEGYKVRKGKSKDPIFLTEEEVKLIKEYTPDYGYLERAKDLFLFQCFTGLAYADLMAFSKESIQLLDGYKTIRSNRVKTDENFISLFLPDAESIADKYKYELPRLTNQKYNEYLKDVATGAGISKTMTSHTARHTFATYLLNKNIPIETVSRALGHTNIKQTQHYARLLGKKVISDMSVLLKDEKKK